MLTAYMLNSFTLMKNQSFSISFYLNKIPKHIRQAQCKQVRDDAAIGIMFKLILKVMKKRADLIVLFFILLLAAFTRMYRMYDLAVFLADQAYDSTAVLNIIRGKLTLLGPITSVGGFHFGPVVYYLMVPFFLILRGDPISGTVFQTSLSLATIPLLYILGKRLKNEVVGLVASFLFAISPLMIDYSRASFNPVPLIFFSSLIIFLVLRNADRRTPTQSFLIGVLLGWAVQMHYLAISLLLFSFFFPFFLYRKSFFISYFSFLITGFLIGVSPFLMFEMRHDFLNTRLFLTYLFSAKESARSIGYALSIWPEVAGKLFDGGNNILGMGFLLLIGSSAVFIWMKKLIRRKLLVPYFLLFVLVLSVALLFGRRMPPHYVISFHMSLFLLLALSIYFILKKNIKLIMVVCFILLVINIPSWNITKEKHELQDGLSIADFKITARIIRKDRKGKYNVGMHAEGDNRAMPLRYTLLLLDEHPEPYTNYSDIDILYFLVKKKESPDALKMWEYTTFGPSITLKKWEINREYYLYKFGKSQSLAES